VANHAGVSLIHADGLKGSVKIREISGEKLLAGESSRQKRENWII
jgi:hypothetical protein